MGKSVLVEGLNTCRRSLNNTKGYREPAECFTKKSSLEHGLLVCQPFEYSISSAYNASPSILYLVVYLSSKIQLTCHLFCEAVLCPQS